MAPKKASTSSVKASSSSKKPVKPLSKQYSISSFLPTLSQSPSPPKKKKRKTEPEPEVVIIDDDEDDIASDHDEEMAPPKSTKPLKGQVNGKGKGKGVAKEVEEEEEDGSFLWSDLYSPTSVDQLAIHPSKLTTLRQTLFESLSTLPISKYRRLIILSGPSGCGKSTAVEMLAKEMGVEVVEWKERGGEEGERTMRAFDEFVGVGGRGTPLDLGSSASPSSSTDTKPEKELKEGKTFLLLSDLPNITHYPTRLSFRQTLLAHISNPRTVHPIVLIISEALGRMGGEGGLMTTGTGGARGERGESIDARSILGKEVLDCRGVVEVQFNPIAPTILKKHLSRTLDLIYSPSGTLPTSARPTAEVLDTVIKSSSGDIRAALNSLQFWSRGGATSKGKKKKGAAAAGMGWMEGRENSLFLFHALGKVLYNKRWGQDATADKKDLTRLSIPPPPSSPPKLPKHLRKTSFDKPPSKVSPDVLFAEAPVDSDVFLSYLHGNVLGFLEEVDEGLAVLEGVSESDAVMRMEEDQWMMRTSLTSQYSFHIAVRSTLINLPSPVPKTKQVLRKSYLWESIKLSDANMRGLEKWGSTGRGRDEWEVAGWRGLIERKRREVNLKLRPPTAKENFWIQFSTFPEGTRGGREGGALDEKDVDEEEEDAGLMQGEGNEMDVEGDGKGEVDGEVEEEEGIEDSEED